MMFIDANRFESGRDGRRKDRVIEWRAALCPKEDSDWKWKRPSPTVDALDECID